MNDLLEQIVKYKKLDYNWDGELGEKAKPESQLLVLLFLYLLNKDYILPNECGLNANGNVSLYWSNKDFELECEFSDNDLIYYYYIDYRNNDNCTKNVFYFKGDNLNKDLYNWLKID